MQTIFERKWLLTFSLFLAFLLTVFIAVYMRLISTKLAYIQFYDTLGHFTLYGLLALLLHFALRGRSIALALFKIRVPLAVILTLLFGASDEPLQTLSPYRSGDLNDFAADAAGMIFFVYASVWIARHKQTQHLSKVFVGTSREG